MTTTLEKTPLHDWHVAHRGRMVEFAGWSMPVQYASIVAEHTATRTAVGLFDISHMGRIRFDGPEAARFLDRLLTRRVTDLAPGQIRYALVTNDAGGILDDVLVYHMRDLRRGTTYYQLVVNASNRRKILEWIKIQHPPADLDYADLTKETAMIAVQGPRAAEVIRPLCDDDPEELRYYHGAETRIAGADAVLSRTGYTGEEGWELIVSAGDAVPLWQSLLPRAEQFGGQPAGLAARDTLRLEAAMPLYGHELSEKINPFQAGLKFAVDLADREFPGREALGRLKDDRSLPRRVGWELAGRRVPREGYAVIGGPHGDETIGQVTSGTYSPTLDQPIAMGYARPEWAQIGLAVSIDIRGQLEPGHVVQLPFYRRAN